MQTNQLVAFSRLLLHAPQQLRRVETMLQAPLASCQLVLGPSQPTNDADQIMRERHFHGSLSEFRQTEARPCGVVARGKGHHPGQGELDPNLAR